MVATYLEIFELNQGGSDEINDFHKKIRVATMIAAENIRTEDGGTVNHANRLIWSKFAFEQSEVAGTQLIAAVLAANTSFTRAQIVGASDSSIQTAVDNAIDIFADGSQAVTQTPGA